MATAPVSRRLNLTRDQLAEFLTDQQQIRQFELLFSTVEKTKEDFNNGVFKDFKDYMVSTTGNILTNIDDSFQFILFHEGMHLGYVMALSKALKN